jgi:hypothetical protein
VAFAHVLEYILIRFTSTIALPHPSSHLLRTMSTDFFVIFSHTNTKYSKYLPSIILSLCPPHHTSTNPQTRPLLPSHPSFFKSTSQGGFALISIYFNLINCLIPASFSITLIPYYSTVYVSMFQYFSLTLPFPIPPPPHSPTNTLGISLSVSLSLYVYICMHICVYVYKITYVLCVNMCLQYILDLTPLLFFCPHLFRTISAGFILLFSYTNTKYTHNIHSYSTFPYAYPSHLVPTCEKRPVFLSRTSFFKVRIDGLRGFHLGTSHLYIVSFNKISILLLTLSLSPCSLNSQELIVQYSILYSYIEGLFQYF